MTPSENLAVVIAAWLGALGPTTISALHEVSRAPRSEIRLALDILERRGVAEFAWLDDLAVAVDSGRPNVVPRWRLRQEITYRAAAAAWSEWEARRQDLILAELAGEGLT